MRPRRLTVFAVLVAACLATGWLFGHAAAVATPILGYVAQTVDAIGGAKGSEQRSTVSSF